MAKLIIKITEDKETKVHEITVSVSHDVNFIHIIDSLRDQFNVEMITARVKTNREWNTVTLQSKNEEKVKMMRAGVVRLAFPYDKQQN